MKLFFLLLILAISCSHAPKRRTDKLSILQGVTNTKEVEFSIMAKKGRKLSFELRSAEGDIIRPDDLRVVERLSSEFSLHKVVFIRDPKKEYNLYAYEGNSIVDQRLVGKGQTNPSHLRMIVISCMADDHAKHFKIWETLASTNPQYLLMIGDNVYADMTATGKPQETNPNTLWDRYTDARLSFPLYFMEKLIPTHAVWDDHDFGKNNGNSDYTYKKESKEIFDAFFAQDLSDDDWIHGQGVGGLLTLGDFNLYFLDGRTFRSPRQDGKHLGIDQETWLINKLREEVSPSFIIKGDQFFGGYHQFESFEGNHPKDFSQFVTKLRETKTPFIFLSGDRHMSEIMQFPRSLFGMPSFEITSSPLHSKTYPDEQSNNNPWRVVSENRYMNFTLIDNLAMNDHWFLEVVSIGENGEPYYRRELAVFIKDLQNNLNETRKRRSGRRRYRRSRRR